MKAFFELTPYFKSFIDISHAYDIYYFAVMEDDYPSWKLMEPFSPFPSSTRKIAFRLNRWDTININDECIYMPYYRFYRME